MGIWDKNVFAAKLQEQSNITTTLNSATTHKSTLSKVLDLFSQGAALRNRNEADVIKMFELAFMENPDLALKCLFYIRDIRGGQGERKTFRTIIKHLGNTYPDRFEHLISLVPEYGRWDDLFSLMGTKLEHKMLEVISNQLKLDLEGSKPTLLGKWLPSLNTSSAATRELAKKLIKFFKVKESDYRKACSHLRFGIDIPERKMSSGKWDKIEYSKVPSRASLLYRKAFYKHDEERYKKFLEDVKNGKQKIKAAALFPYDIIREYIGKYGLDDTLEAQWKALPNFLEKEESALVLCDVSGSMMWGHNSGNVKPLHVAISLAIYISERVKGPFANTWMTFSAKPTIKHLTGKTVYEKVTELRNDRDFGLNTNIQACFDCILNMAKQTNCSQEDLPKYLLIVSDMEFDNADSDHAPGSTVMGKPHNTNFEVIKKKFENAGYQMPTLVFWNVDSKTTQSPVTKNEKGVFLVSGCSPSILKNALNRTELIQTAEDLMLAVINTERYAPIGDSAQ